MEPFPDVLVVSDNDGRVYAVCSGCVKEGEKVEVSRAERNQAVWCRRSAIMSA